ncbi:lysostaphin resistance A-like protein [Daejeonella sp.]|jgi:membrane protease YdiL (CAAX protease family)|uniref:lysostaphin resistance A-like protein n=1 Tax=Daejeonella sp. TaxID=2805397 RepID=UPI0037BE31EB
MFKSRSTERHPFSSLLLLLLLVFTCAIAFTIIAFVAGILIYGFQPIISMSESDSSNVEMLRLLQIVSSFGMFVVAAFIFAKIQSSDWLTYLNLKKFNLVLAILTLLIILSFSPLLEFSNELNKNMVLPKFLNELEAWMKLKEAQMAEMTKQLLVMKSIPVLLINLLMLAIIPAVGEEFIFRGCLQKIFGRWIGNYHIAIWITAIIFSAIHFQFYGFMPRMLLGALFGYLLVWSGSLWLPILAHFMNNGVAVVTAYVFQQQGKPLELMYESDPASQPVFIASIAVMAVLLWYFYNYSFKLKEINTELSDGSRLG